MINAAAQLELVICGKFTRVSVSSEKCPTQTVFKSIEGPVNVLLLAMEPNMDKLSPAKILKITSTTNLCICSVIYFDGSTRI